MTTADKQFLDTIAKQLKDCSEEIIRQALDTAYRMGRWAMIVEQINGNFPNHAQKGEGVAS